MVLYEVDLGLFDGPSSAVQSRTLLLLHRLLTLFQIHREIQIILPITPQWKKKVNLVYVTK